MTLNKVLGYVYNNEEDERFIKKGWYLTVDNNIFTSNHIAKLLKINYNTLKQILEKSNSVVNKNFNNEYHQFAKEEDIISAVTTILLIDK